MLGGGVAGCVGGRVCGWQGVWVAGCVGVWVAGCVGGRVCGCVGGRVCGGQAVWGDTQRGRPAVSLRYTMGHHHPHFPDVKKSYRIYIYSVEM